MTDFNITSAQYTQSQDTNDGIEAVIDSVTVYLSLDPANRHYQAILEWVAEGNTITPAS